MSATVRKPDWLGVFFDIAGVILFITGVWHIFRR
jgi:hypothetical protein